jgi:hypothetical protein
VYASSESVAGLVASLRASSIPLAGATTDEAGATLTAFVAALSDRSQPGTPISSAKTAYRIGRVAGWGL